ncbi:MAG: hypothetical protein ACKOEP_01775 [Phycisphaerales bacterium]
MNGSKGAVENRRVELFLTPLSFDMAMVESSEERTPAESAAATKAPATRAPQAAPVADDDPTK